MLPVHEWALILMRKAKSTATSLIAHLYFQVILGVMLGIIIGLLKPDWAESLNPTTLPVRFSA
jgi:Na+/H+-dicarboxylate symporter